MRCVPVKDIVAAVETDEFSPELDAHLAACEACAQILESLRHESEGLTISVGALWVKERISCPHNDILLSFVNGALGGEEGEYIEFHLETVGCPSCQARVGELQGLMDKRGPESLKRALDESMRRSAAFLEDLKGS